jgi:AraC-like DNA-binding protein
MSIPVHSDQKNKLFIKWRDIVITPDNVEVAHQHDYYQIMFLEKVSGSHTIDFENYPAESHSIHFIGLGRVHQVHFTRGTTGGLFLFPNEIFSHTDRHLLSSLRYFQNGSDPVLNLKAEDFKLVMALVNLTKSNLDEGVLDLSRHLLFSLLIKVRQLYMHYKDIGVDSKSFSELASFREWMATEGVRGEAVEVFCDVSGLSKDRLNQLCKKQYGKTALQMLHERRLLEAKRLLVYTEKQVKEVAYDCGFEDVAYFNRFFKKYTHLTPSDFRKHYEKYK